MELKSILILDPFYGGSHKQLSDFIVRLARDHSFDVAFLTLSAKKWHWRARTSALYFFQKIPLDKCYRTLFASSVLNLAELLSLCPKLQSAYKVIYFHENQLSYPVRLKKDRDFQYGYNQILTWLLTFLTADRICFNSKYNLDSFLDSIPHFLKQIPEHNLDVPAIRQKIEPKAQVLYFPLDFEFQDSLKTSDPGDFCFASTPVKCEKVESIGFEGDSQCPAIAEEHSHGADNALVILWSHRWEHDKDPETFFDTILRLKEASCRFRLLILGQQFSDNPEVFEKMKHELKNEIIHWGYVEDKTDYYRFLQAADVAISTSLHEFFGISMLEAAYAGCAILAPNRLVYPEIFPKECLYNTSAQLLKRLKQFCSRPDLVRKQASKLQYNFARFDMKTLTKEYSEVLGFS